MLLLEAVPAEVEVRRVAPLVAAEALFAAAVRFEPGEAAFAAAARCLAA